MLIIYSSICDGLTFNSDRHCPAKVTHDGRERKDCDKQRVWASQSKPVAVAEIENTTTASKDASSDFDLEWNQSNESFVGRTMAKLYASTWTIVACIGTGLGGLALGWLAFSVDLTQLPVAPKEEPRYIATAQRRSEPLDPLVPYSDLDPYVIDLGRRLFHDRAISGNGRISCASCHHLGITIESVHRSHARGADVVQSSNIPTVLNATLNFVAYGDGRVETLDDQLDISISSETELNSDWERIVTYLKSNPSYKDAFSDHFGAEPTEDLAKEAFRVYLRSLVTVESSFDLWLAGNEDSLNADQYTGYLLFKRYNCIRCHHGAMVGGSMFQPLGPLKEYFLMSRELSMVDFGRFNVTEKESDKFHFRVPSLRNVELTAPYFHDGSAETVLDAVEQMLRYNAGVEPNAEEVRRIGEFLKTLTGKRPEDVVPNYDEVGRKDEKVESE